jgi:lipid A oxidase
MAEASASGMRQSICALIWPAQAASCRSGPASPPLASGIITVAALFCLIVQSPATPLRQWVAMSLPGASDAPTKLNKDGSRTEFDSGETMFGAYVGNPAYYRSTVHYKRPDGTDLQLLGVGWDGDALYFPIDGGVRWIKWGERAGFMVDFFHSKAIARLGRGAHGSRKRYAVVEEVPVEGMIKGKPAPPRMLLTDLFERFEFTHGHNMLFFTGLVRMSPPMPSVVPYAGIGAGFALPHTEVRFTGEPRETRTSEYQFAGPAAQILAGLELKIGRMSYFLEYKFNYAWIWGAMTGGHSWKNWNMPGDLWRQFDRWRKGEKPKYGEFYTTLGAHQINVGAGYRWPGKAPAAVVPKKTNQQKTVK